MSAPPVYPVVTEAAERDLINAVMPDKLYLTNWRGAADMAALRSLGITHIAAVGSEFVEDAAEGMVYWKKDILDVDDAGDQMSGALRDGAAFIHEALQRGGRCLVHCAAGVSRSATIVLAFLLLHGERMDLRSALVHLHRCRPAIWPNDGFMSALIALEATERGGRTSLALAEYVAWGDYEPETSAVAAGAHASVPRFLRVETTVDASARARLSDSSCADDDTSTPTSDASGRLSSSSPAPSRREARRDSLGKAERLALAAAATENVLRNRPQLAGAATRGTASGERGAGKYGGEPSSPSRAARMRMAAQASAEAVLARSASSAGA